MRGLPKLGKPTNAICGPCQLGKQTKVAHKKINSMVTSYPLELIHIDLMDPTQTESLGGKRYIFLAVYDYSRFSWVHFLKHKSNSFDVFRLMCFRLQKEQRVKIGCITRIRTDNGKDFKKS